MKKTRDGTRIGETNGEACETDPKGRTVGLSPEGSSVTGRWGSTPLSRVTISDDRTVDSEDPSFYSNGDGFWKRVSVSKGVPYRLGVLCLGNHIRRLEYEMARTLPLVTNDERQSPVSTFERFSKK